MISKSRARSNCFLPIGLIALALAPTAFAQDSYSGTWQIAEVSKPDWTEPNAEPQVAPMKIGDGVEFREGKVIADGVLACELASFKTAKTNQASLFQNSISAVDSSAKIAARFNLGSAPETLLVNCDDGVKFEYHKDTMGRLVVLSDSLVYTLKRSQ